MLHASYAKTRDEAKDVGFFGSVIGAVRGDPHGATTRVRSVPKRVAATHVATATGACGGAPYGATERVSMDGGGAYGHRQWGCRR
eukprot:3699806-Pyramimonas_sp.AAC.1